MLQLVCFAAAFICFILSTVKYNDRLNLESLGLLFLTIALVFNSAILTK